MADLKAQFHLPGLFEFYDFYKEFFPLYFTHREYFYDWCTISSVYGSPDGCIWGGGRTGNGTADTDDVITLMNEYGISCRLTFSNSLLKKEHLNDRKCIELCSKFENECKTPAGIIIHSDMLLEFLKEKFSSFYYISSTTKVITEFEKLKEEINRSEFKFIVPDFRFNNNFEKLFSLNTSQKDKIEFLVNECCWTKCMNRKLCYENVSRKNLGEDVLNFHCKAPEGNKGYVFSKAMEKPEFIGLNEIQNEYLTAGFSNFKIEGRNLGSALILEFLLYYLTKPEYHLKVREALYLDNMLDLF